MTNELLLLFTKCIVSNHIIIIIYLIITIRDVSGELKWYFFAECISDTRQNKKYVIKKRKVWRGYASRYWDRTNTSPPPLFNFLSYE